mgnify:FL=1
MELGERTTFHGPQFCITSRKPSPIKFPGLDENRLMSVL